MSLNDAGSQCREAATDWGLQCMRYEIRDISPPPGVKAAMELQAEAERRKRAQVAICLSHIKSLAGFVCTTYQPVKQCLAVCGNLLWLLGAIINCLVSNKIWRPRLQM